jgi:hypothetical protein
MAGAADGRDNPIAGAEVIDTGADGDHLSDSFVADDEERFSGRRPPDLERGEQAVRSADSDLADLELNFARGRWRRRVAVCEEGLALLVVDAGCEHADEK